MSTIPGIPQTQLEDIGLSSAAAKTDKSTDSTTDFLQLFVAQLRNQNPLEPQEGAEFLGQLAQFSTVEGIKNLESSFTNLANSVQSTSALQASSMVGRNVEVQSDKVVLNEGGNVKGSINVPSSVTDLTLEIVNSQGQVVKTMNLGSAEAGFYPFNWNGMDDGDAALPPGIYNLQAKGTVEGDLTNFITMTEANVDSVTIDKNGQGLVLNVAGHGPVNLEDIRTIS